MKDTFNPYLGPPPQRPPRIILWHAVLSSSVALARFRLADASTPVVTGTNGPPSMEGGMKEDVLGSAARTADGLMPFVINDAIGTGAL